MSKILIVDDTVSVLDFLEFIFSRQGFEVIKSISGYDAVEKAKEFHPDIALIDVMMPGIDGFEVCKLLRTIPESEKLTILLFSAKVGDEVRDKAESVGADGFLGKTIHHSELVSIVRDWLAYRSSPGATGQPEYIEFVLDLISLLQVELVWLLQVNQSGLENLAVACEGGRQEALRFLDSIGREHIHLDAQSPFVDVLRRDRPLLYFPLENLRWHDDSDRIFTAMKRFNSLSVSIVPLKGPSNQRGVLFFSSPRTLSVDHQMTRSISTAIRYASLALSLKSASSSHENL